MITLPFEAALLEELSRELEELQKTDLSAYLKAQIILPTRRAVKDLKNHLFERQTRQNDKPLNDKSQRATTSVLLPRIVSVTDLVCDDISLKTISDIEATGLCLFILQEMGEPLSLESVQTLLSLMSDVATFEVDLGHIENLVPETYAEHWQVTSDFLQVFAKKWQEALDQKSLVLPATKTIKGYKKLAENWCETPPVHPVWMAGVDGYIPALSTLMKTIDVLPQGKVFWSGILPHAEVPCKKNHPNYLYQKNCVIEGDIKKEGEVKTPLVERTNLLSHMMSDVPFDKREFEATSFEGISLFEADSLDQEAEMIALLARENLEDPLKTTAIMTPDPDLSHKIQQALARFNIRVDVAGGRPLSKTKQGQYVLDVLSLPSVMSHDQAPLVLSVLKNKFTRLMAESSFKLQKSVSEFELSIRSHSGKDHSQECLDLKEKYHQSLAPLIALKQQEKISLKSWIEVHVSLLKGLAPDVFQGELGATIESHFSSLEEGAHYYPDLDFQAYRDLIKMRLASSMEREAINHPRLKLMSPIQGAYASFDCVILGGLNEGVWPAMPPQNPWLNLDMQLQLGLPDSQVLLGRGAWLLVQNMRNPEVIMSYSKRRGADPATPSRWVLRLKALENILKDVWGSEKTEYEKTEYEKIESGKTKSGKTQLSLSPHYKKWQSLLDASSESQVPERPMPSPPLERRPKRLSVSDIQRLFRDPYQIYAKKVLSLYPLGGLESEVESSDYGTFVHGLLECHVLEQKEFSQLLKEGSYEKIKKAFPLCGPSDFFLWRQSISQYLPWLESYLSSQLLRGCPLTPEVFVEKKLTHIMTELLPNIEIIGTADRIDRLSDGTYEIIDYKTGYVPTKKDVESFMAPQLALLGMLFERSYPGKRVSKLTYVGLGQQKVISFDAAPLIKETEIHLQDVLEQYQDKEMPYDISVMASLQDPFNDYAHLERTSEWLASLQSQKEGEA